MAYLNKVFLMGNLGKDPEIRTFQSGSKCATFSLATSKRYRDQNGEQKEQTQWHTVKVLGRSADTLQQLGVKKGTQMLVEGELTYSTWTDQTTGQKRYSTDVVCELMKERPMRDYEKQNGKSPIIGTRAEESFRRAVGWMKSGCNSFAGNRAKSTPLSLWLESDVLRYIDENGIKLSPMYTEGGMKRTGCMFCPVPIAHGDLTNIEYARTHHPKIYATMMIKHGLKAMLDKAQNHNGQQELFNG